jgi:hypothetical protein
MSKIQLGDYVIPTVKCRAYSGEPGKIAKLQGNKIKIRFGKTIGKTAMLDIKNVKKVDKNEKDWSLLRKRDKFPLRNTRNATQSSGKGK